ncbi:hypothetical protein SEA_PHRAPPUCCINO_157 [Mycobacterium phage Phrappuccino]|uniref:Uncharacterized protein n=1 Tax=Mycobacterium phage Phrappuccino TaxID=2591223 RepID=A0A514DDZ2_9CAUD|nr:hypothetical protein KHQ87_gp157 [Mycobacterium phage Phrappuccino]QDH91832.1 hypothetical protein SEA_PHRAPPUCCINO_157 [Mycobacterium phage Phrappuccino]QIQ63274.1 hypothetical protein SEA_SETTECANDELA_157 [Mycobacterium phage Settecandela]
MSTTYYAVVEVTEDSGPFCGGHIDLLGRMLGRHEGVTGRTPLEIWVRGNEVGVFAGDTSYLRSEGWKPAVGHHGAPRRWWQRWRNHH